MSLSKRELERLNREVIRRVEDYSKLKIHGREVRSPYFMNNAGWHLGNLMREVGIGENQIDEWSRRWKEKEVPFAWHRGKGTPEQLAEAVHEISEKVGLPLKRASSGVVREFMKLYGLGVDCSGFVFEVLRFGFGKMGKEKMFVDSLDWSSEVRDASRAGAFVFAGEASRVVGFDEIQPLDLLLFKNRTGKYNHIAILVDDNGLVVAQSGISRCPSGVGKSQIKMDDGEVRFSYRPEIGKSWEKLLQEGRLEFRRLKILG